MITLLGRRLLRSKASRAGIGSRSGAYRSVLESAARRRVSRAAPFGRVLVLCLLVVILAGCSSYSDKAGKIRAGLEAGDPVLALAELEKMGGKDELPFLMEQGLLRYLNGDLTGAQASLKQAQVVIDDLYTKSLSKTALTMIINDSMQDYQGEIFERLWTHFYRALAFIEAGDLNAAAVEGRAVTFNAQRFSDQGEEDAKYRNDPFLQLFAGWLYEADGELNDAWINYRDAEQLYRAEDVYGVSPPDGLYADLIDAGLRLGFRDQIETYLAAREAPVRGREDHGEVVLLVSTGLMPPKVSRRMDFPIFKHKDKHNSDNTWIAGNSWDRWNHQRHGYDIADVEYILSIALPEVLKSPPAPRVVWSAAGHGGDLELCANLGEIERQCLADRYKGVVIRTVMRALTKYWAKEKVEDKNKVAGFLTDVLGSVTEVADTRGWSTLPAHLHFARIELPAGPRSVTVRSGAVTLQGEVEVQPGRLSFLHLRAY